MYISIWIIFFKLYFFRTVTIDPEFKDLNWFLERSLIRSLPKGEEKMICGIPHTIYGDEYELTTAGKDYIFNHKAHLISRAIAILALLISFLSYIKK